MQFQFRLEKTLDTSIPIPLKVLLSEVCEGLYFLDKQQLSCKGISDLVSRLEDSYPKLWPKERYIPFGGSEESLLAIDLKSGAVLEWDSDDGNVFFFYSLLGFHSVGIFLRGRR